MVLGSDEIRNNQVSIKDLAAGEQHSVAHTEAANVIRQMLATGRRSSPCDDSVNTIILAVIALLGLYLAAPHR